MKDQPIVLEAEAVDARTKTECSQHRETVGRQIQKCARIVARLLACFINDRLDACALQRDAQCRSTNPAAHNHDML